MKWNCLKFIKKLNLFTSLVDFPKDGDVKFANCPTTSNLIRKSSNQKVINQTELLRKASTNTAPIKTLHKVARLLACYVIVSFRVAAFDSGRVFIRLYWKKIVLCSLKFSKTKATFILNKWILLVIEILQVCLRYM